MSAEHVPGLDDAACPQCECPDCPVRMQCTSEHEIWNKQTRTRTPVRITRRRRQCSNRNCGVLFWTTQREEVDRG